MEYSMVANWSAGFYEVKSDGPTLYHGIFYRVNAPYEGYMPFKCSGLTISSLNLIIKKKKS
jgi:hypothetical protein